MTRREWLKSFAAAALALGTGPWRALQAAVLRRRRGPMPPPVERAPGDYSVIVLGDTHFDGLVHATYHSHNPNPPEYQIEEWDRNAGMWADRCPRLLQAAAARMTSDTAFAIQLGDLVQGDCNDDSTHEQMATDAFAAIKNALGRSLPLCLVTGNHDIRKSNSDSSGAADTYYAWQCARMTEEMGKTVDNTTFYFTHGPDLYISVNFNSPSMPVIEEALAAHPDARYKFLMTHGPVLPSDITNFTWHLWGGSASAVSRLKLRKMLLENDVIVLAGHIHTTELTEVMTDEGRITQVIASSVWSPESRARSKPSRIGPEAYGLWQETEPGKDRFAEYRPAVTRYLRSSLAGYMRMEVGARGVTMRVYGGASSTPSHVWRLR